MSRKDAAVWAVLLAPIVAGGSAHFASAASPRESPAIVRDTTTCLDTLHASDSVPTVVTMRVRAQDGKTALPPDFEGLFVQEFRSHLKVPTSLALSAMNGWDPCVGGRCAGGVLILRSRAYVTAHAKGTLSRIKVIDFSLTPAFSDSVRAALESMSRENVSPPLLNGLDSIPLRISIGDDERPDTVGPVRRLFRASVPHYNLPFTYAEWPKNANGPKYPMIAERNGIEDSVKLSFVVLPDGTVDPQAVDVEAGHYMEFIRAVFDRLAATRYVPARVGSCAVASAASQFFVFKMPR